MVEQEIQVSEPASSEERRKRLDYLVDEASMLSFPASDPPAVFVEEPGPTRERTRRSQASPTRRTEEREPDRPEESP